MSILQISSPIGQLSLKSNGAQVTGLWMEAQRFHPQIPQAETADPILEQAVRWLDAYFRGLQPDPATIPLKPEGTDFQMKVWNALRQIPYGQTVTYGQLARQLGCGSAQAIGQAVGRNPISILIPCHRVIAGNGLGGYAGGSGRKEFLLRLEQHNQ